MKPKNGLSIVILLVTMILISAAFFLGYYGIQLYFAVPSSVETFVQEYEPQKSAGALSGKGEGKSLSPVRTDLLLFTKEKTTAVISVLNSEAHSLNFFTLPADTYIELSEEQYRSLSARYPSLPQIFWLDVIMKYMDAADAAEVLAWVLGEKLYCVFQGSAVIAQESDFGWLCFEEDCAVVGPELAGLLKKKETEKNILERLKAWTAPERVKKETLYCYAETIALLEPGRCGGEIIAGRQANGGYHLDIEIARKRIWQQ